MTRSSAENDERIECYTYEPGQVCCGASGRKLRRVCIYCPNYIPNKRKKGEDEEGEEEKEKGEFPDATHPWRSLDKTWGYNHQSGEPQRAIHFKRLLLNITFRMNEFTCLCMCVSMQIHLTLFSSPVGK